MKIAALKYGLLFVSILLVALPLYLALQRVDSLNEFVGFFSSRDDLRAFVDGFGAAAPVMFFLLQTLQIIAAPIPGNVTTLVGGMLFGFWKSFGITVAALVTGSSVAFMLARVFGRPLVDRFVSRRITDRYLDRLSGRYTVYLFLLFLFPFFPDDALCFLAGLTAIRYPVFLLLVVTARPPGLAFSALVGSGIISVPLWGWIAIGAISAVLIWMCLRYGERIEIRLEGFISGLQDRARKAV
jgi:uncharacterized membrane protein YdjX (TVP38/TMEM64 family)